MRLAVDWAKDQKDEREEADGINAEGQGGHGPAGAFRQAARLPGVKEISKNQRQGDAGQDAAHDQRLRQARDDRTKADHDDELAEIVDEEAEETVDIVRDKPAAQKGRGWGARHADVL